MDSKVTEEWTPSEREEVKELLSELNNDKQHIIMEELATRFLAKTMQQLRDVYVDLVVEMQCSDHGGWNMIPSTDNLAPFGMLENDNFGLPKEVVSLPIAYNSDLESSDATTLLSRSPEVVVIEEEKEEFDNEPAPKKGRFWTKEEHRCDWKNIARNFVTTRSPLQVSSHQHKYFKRLRGEQKHRHSINDVGITNQNLYSETITRQGFALTETGSQSSGHLARPLGTSNASTGNNQNRFWSPYVPRPVISTYTMGSVQPAFSSMITGGRGYNFSIAPVQGTFHSEQSTQCNNNVNLARQMAPKYRCPYPWVPSNMPPF